MSADDEELKKVIGNSLTRMTFEWRGCMDAAALPDVKLLRSMLESARAIIAAISHYAPEVVEHG